MHSDTNRIWTLRHNKKTLETSSSGPTHQNKRCPSVFSGFLAPSFYGKTLRDENKKQAVSFLFISLFNYFSRRLHSKQWVCWGGAQKECWGWWWWWGGGCLPLVRVIQRTSLLTSPLSFQLASLPSIPYIPSSHRIPLPPHPPHPPRWQPLPQAPAGSMHRPTYLNIRGTGWRIACKADCSSNTPPPHPPRSSVIHSFMNSLIFITKKREKDLNCTRI